jgi:hypothetical protein
MENKNEKETLHKELVALLSKGSAHSPVEDILDGIPFDTLGKVPRSLPYSIWQLAEHIRIAQWDMVEFSKSARHKSPKWPDEYWPKEKAPTDAAAWENCIKQIKKDRKAFIKLLDKDGVDIYAPFPHGDGQNLLHEALQIADHTSYHLGEILVLRRLLGIWKK